MGVNPKIGLYTPKSSHFKTGFSIKKKPSILGYISLFFGTAPLFIYLHEWLIFVVNDANVPVGLLPNDAVSWYLKKSHFRKVQASPTKTNPNSRLFHFTFSVTLFLKKTHLRTVSIFL